MRNLVKTAVALLLILLATVPAQSIIIRHDRDDARYLELGKKYPAVCFMVPDGEGTLIAPQWVLTAAHVAEQKQLERVRFDDGAEYAITQKILHPEWRDGQPHDIALVKLAEPVRGVAPVALYEASDEVGKTVLFVGRGDHGTGMTGPKVMDKKKRAATNVVDSADANWLRFTFDEPPAGTDLEGVSGPGDSGGPALIERGGKLYIAGVSVFGSRGKYGPQTYGTREGYTRISTHLAWIRNAMSGSVPQAQPAAPAATNAQATATQTIPDTPAGRRMGAWLPVINRGDAAEITKFVRENFAKSALERMPAEERTQVHKDFFAETGGLKVHSVRKSEPLEVEILAQAAKGGAWHRVGLRVEPDAPNGILGFLFDEAQPPTASGSAATPATPGRKLSDAEIAADIEKLVNENAAQDRFSGTVLLAKNGKPFLEKAWGKASIRYDVANKIDTKFNLGSMNKMFTAVAIAQLAEQGKLSFDDKVGKHVPDYPNAAVRDKVTIHHLLTHSSGLGSYFASKKYDETWIKIRTVDGFLNTFVHEPLQFEPGERFSYSNSGFIVLGKIIEKVSGMSYYDYIREKIYKPAGMINSDAFEMDHDVTNLATGYTRNDPATDRPGNVLRNNYFQHSIKGGPAGGGFSTVQDLLRFDQALRSGKLVGKKFADTLLTGKIAMGGGGTQYGYGFGVQTLPSKSRIVGHSGGAPGINAWLDMYWEDGYTVAVMCNLDRCAGPVVQRAKQLILGQ